jgi:hypothetical protein
MIQVVEDPDPDDDPPVPFDAAPLMISLAHKCQGREGIAAV